jgi:hypothetical protein
MWIALPSRVRLFEGLLAPVESYTARILQMGMLACHALLKLLELSGSILVHAFNIRL